MGLGIRDLSEAAACFCCSRKGAATVKATFMRLSFSLCLAALNVVPCLQEISEICVVLRLFAIFAMYFRFCLHVDLFCGFCAGLFFQDALRSARLSETFANFCAYGPCVFNRLHLSRCSLSALLPQAAPRPQLAYLRHVCHVGA